MHYLEPATSLSASILWSLQREFYLNNGLSSWNQVPFHITSNPFIAHQYAEVVVGLILDLKAQNKLQHEPLYILELGTGSGQFSYLFLRALESILALYGLAEVKYCYIMSDFADFAFEHWVENLYFKRLVEQGKLDFALYDLEYSTTLELHHTQQQLVIQDLPLVTIANYVFDSLRHDSFIIESYIR